MEDETAAPVPEDMAGRSGLRSHVARSDDHLAQRPEELLARLARALRMYAITEAVLFPDSPSLRARWDRERKRWTSPTTGEIVDGVAIRDRAIHLHRGGESEPTSVIPFGKVEHLVAHVLALEEQERFRRMTTTSVASSDLAALVREVRELGGRLDDLRDEVQSTAPPGSEAVGSVETTTDRPGAHLRVVDATDELTAPGAAPTPSTSPEPLARARAVGVWLLSLLDLERRDLGALFWVCVAGIVSSYTTHAGAVAIGLPSEIATVATVFVVGFLFTLLVGAALSHSPIRKLAIELVLASVCVYCGFVTYYNAITHGERVASADNRAAEAHAALVGELYGPHAAELEALRKEASAASEALDDEVKLGKGTGRTGYGPEGKRLAAEARELDRQVARLDGRVTAMAIATTPIDGLSPDEILDLDLRIWTATPADWRGPRPERDAYVDLAVAASSPVLLPVDAFGRRDPVAYLALGCALVVEGIMILCGFGIEKRRRERLVRRVTRASTRLVRELRDGVESVRESRRVQARPAYAWLDEDEVPRG